MSKAAFDKFINPKTTGAKKKEEIRQEKKKVKAELRTQAADERKRNESKYGVVTKESKSQITPQPERINREENFTRKTYTVKRSDKAVGKRALTKSDTPQTKYRKQEPTEGAQSGRVTREPKSLQLQSAKDQMPLNKYVAHAGISGRREAAELVKAGHVTVNGDIVYEPGFKVTETDKITVKGKPVHLQKNLVYILINKPKDYITTAKDPEGRKTVFEIVAHATKERIYPVGRLDRNTTGVLLMTNDGELAQKLTHPSFEIKKIYEVKLDKPLVKKDFDAILSGVMLEDGMIQADSVGYADSKDKSVIGIEIHSGRNRIVRRLFEHLGYDVRNLDRVMFANLTKKNVDRGKWRFLNEKEVRLLKYLNQSFVRGSKD